MTKPLIIDGHCDSLLSALGRNTGLEEEPRDLLARGKKGHADVPRLLEGGVSCQFMALFTGPAKVEEGTRAFAHALIDELERIIAGAGKCRMAVGASDIEAAYAEKGLSFLLTIEGGEPIGESLDELRAFYKRGVRLMGLTWNHRNAIGRGVRADGSDGLSPFGKTVVAEMEKQGMIVDASHLCDQAFSDLLEIAQRPVVASHSNARALCPDLRNLSDGQIEAIARSGGVVAATLVPIFVSQNPYDVSMEMFLRHIDHIVSVAGIDHVGIGSDFDGYAQTEKRVVDDAAAWPQLVSALLARAYSEADCAKIVGGNWLRVIRAILD